MRLRAPRHPRLVGWPWPAVAAAVIWGALVLAAWQVDATHGLPLCLTRRVTGVPCPTCGSTRAALALARVDIAGALESNPLVTVALGIAAAWLAIAIVAGRRVAIDLTPRQRVWAWAFVAAGLAANWAYVLAREG